MSNREKVRRAEQSRRSIEARASFTIDEWCQFRRISRPMYYKLAKQGRAPLTHRVGEKPLISSEADEVWIRAREAEAVAVA
jgi:hypothetical protein